MASHGISVLPSQPSIPRPKAGAGAFSFFRIDYHSSNGHLVQSSVPEVDENGNPLRRRTSHGKSRNGCERCKARRVRCDGTAPVCQHCQRRKEPCSLSSPSQVPARTNPKKKSAPSTSESSEACSPASCSPDFAYDVPAIRLRSTSPEAGLSPFNLQPKYLHLLHHFSNTTSSTLMFGSEFWLRSLPLALDPTRSSLFHAILATTAAHMTHLSVDPQASEYRQMQFYHTALSCRELRISIETQGSKIEYIDSYLGTSFLLFQNAWDLDKPSKTSSDNESLLLSDRILPYSKGLKSLIIATLTSCGLFQNLEPALARLTDRPIMVRQQAGEMMLVPSFKKTDLEKVSILLPRMIYFRSLKRMLDYYLSRAENTHTDQGISAFQFGEQIEQRLLEWLKHVWHCRCNVGGSDKADGSVEPTDEICIEDFIDAGRRLFPVLVMLKIRKHVTPQSSKGEEDGECRLFEGPSWIYMKHVIARYLFMWPIKTSAITCPASDDVNVPATGAKYAKQVLWLYYCITIQHSVMNNGDEDMTNGVPPYWWSVHRVEGMLRALWACVTAGNTEGIGGGCEACLSLALDLSAPEILIPSFSNNSDHTCAP